MVGTLEQEEVTWGLVQTNDGTIHRVKQGNYVGQNHGRIVRVSDSLIELTELVPAGRGFVEREAALSMGEE
jgi:type IV pilus assembly protein PilP